jgi:hypothetical protein
MAGADEAVPENESFAFVLPGGQLLKGVMIMKKVLMVLALVSTVFSAATKTPTGRRKPPPPPCKSGINARPCPPGPLVPGR